MAKALIGNSRLTFVRVERPASRITQPRLIRITHFENGSFQYTQPPRVVAEAPRPGCRQLRSVPGSAWDRTAIEARPRINSCCTLNQQQAEPASQCVPRQSLGTRLARSLQRTPFGNRMIGR